MKIHPPKLTIDPKNPFKDALFSRKEFAASLTNLLQEVSEGLVILVHAPWGAGKTTFAHMWLADLKARGRDVAYFDAYAADYFNDPFVCFSGEILELADQKLKADKGLIARNAFRNKAIHLGKRLAGVAAKAAIKSATLGIVDQSAIDGFKEIGSEFATGLASVGSELIEKQIENYAARKESLNGFKQTLKDLAALIREEQEFPLTIIVDELDRCHPAFALQLLDRIKHLFHVEGVAFVLLVNRDQIESYIRTIYGTVDANTYLQKFATVFVDLPHQGSEYTFEHESGRADFCRTLFAHYGLDTASVGPALLPEVEDLAEHFQLTLREIEKLFGALTLFYASKNLRRGDHLLIPVLSVLKIRHPAIYKRLGNNQISYQDFISETRLDTLKLQARGADPILHKVFSICLMSGPEYEKARREDEHPMGIICTSYSEIASLLPKERHTIIPSLCHRMDRFSMKP